MYMICLSFYMLRHDIDVCSGSPRHGQEVYGNYEKKSTIRNSGDYDLWNP